MNIDYSYFMEGIFVKELKNRFLCEVMINNKSVECYVPSSSHLSNFINLSNSKVLLIENPANARTAYSLFAFKFKNKYVLLNTSIANKLIYEDLKSQKFYFLGKRNIVYKEYKLLGYKSDIYIEDTKSFVEIKSLLSVGDRGLFPTVYSERSIRQLNMFIDFLKKGYKVYFFIVSLNPYLKKIEINKNSDFYILLRTCIGLGLKVYGFKIDFDKDFRIKKIPCRI